MDIDTNTLAKIEAIIFSEGGEMSSGLALSTLGVSDGELKEIIKEYNNSGRGTVLVQDDKKIIMRVAGEYAGIIEELRKDSLNTDISKAGLEVLAIVLYCEGGSISTSEIEYIRGVNSGYTLRQLTVRGLLSKKRVGMGYKYAPTAELLSFLGVTSVSDLPEVHDVQNSLAEFLASKDDAE